MTGVQTCALPIYNRHLAFGWAAHFCFGAPLARLEGQIAFETLLRRLPELALEDGVDLQWRENLGLRGLKALPVRFGAPAEALTGRASSSAARTGPARPSKQSGTPECHAEHALSQERSVVRASSSEDGSKLQMARA